MDSRRFNFTGKLFSNHETAWKIVSLLIIGTIVFHRSASVLRSTVNGDGVEYILTTEAIYNHITPDIRPDDLKHFKEDVIQVKSWGRQEAWPEFDKMEEFLNTPGKKFMDNREGYFVAKSGKIYGYHFFFYSLLNVPFRVVAGWFNQEPVTIYRYVNGFFSLCTCAIILFWSPFPLFPTLVAAFSFFFSPVYWYHDWTHTEVYTMCFVAAGMWLALGKKYLTAVLLLSIACLQNQPLIALTGIYFLGAVAAYRFSYRKIALAAAAGAIVMLPSVFYYLNYGTFNLINEVGFLHQANVTPTRVWGFFTDLDQGMILAIPVALILYPVLWVSAVFATVRRKQFPAPELYIPFALLVMTLSVSTMGNWNHGQAVINRYATWTSTIVLIAVVSLLVNRMNSKMSIAALMLIAVSQIATTLYHRNIYLTDRWATKHKPFTEWVLTHFPKWYNPDPVIFMTRCDFTMMSQPGQSNGFIDKNGNITKLLVHQDRLDELIDFGADSNALERIKPTLKVINGWAYIHPVDVGFIRIKNREKNKGLKKP